MKAAPRPSWRPSTCTAGRGWTVCRPADEPTIARALAKDPEQRFASCRDMIEALMEASARSAAADGPVARRPRVHGARRRSKTSPPGRAWKPKSFRGTTISAARAAAGGPPCNKTQLTEAAAGRSRNLPPLALEPAEIECRPTIFLGVGGLAVRTLLYAPSADRGAVRRSGRAAGLAVPALRDRRRKPENGHRLRPCRR